MANNKIVSHNPEETILIAARFARNLKAGDIVFLKGDLGAGKTTFTKGLAQAFQVKKTEVNSPTFIIMNYYEGKLPIYHFDFYRLNNESEISTVDMEEYFYGQGVSVIEWPERLGEFAPKEFFEAHLEHESECKRTIGFSASGKDFKSRLNKMMPKIKI
jgi:tRNA threonylcarbamoyladenosine biosynthesis protein TsaE